jgi:DNA-binding response OmpR family regulator
MHILMIEPDVLLADTYRRSLALDGHSVVVAASAQDGVHQADEQPPDVVVLEVQLPGHNGIEFLYEFRSYHEWLHIPVVIHSFVPPSELTATPTLQQELGVVRLLHKPTTSLSQLRTAIRLSVPVPQV